MTAEVVTRQRALVPDQYGSLEGWMDENAAAAAGQLFGSGPAGLLVVDTHELLASTARVVGASLGELHFKVWMTLITLHVAHGMPEDGKGESTLSEFANLVWGPDTPMGGKNRRMLLKTLSDLREARFILPGYDFDTRRTAPAVSDTNLLINLKVDEVILRAFERPGSVSPEEMGKALGGRNRGTVKWRLHPDYTQELAQADLRRLDLAKAQKLRGAALALWLQFTSPRVPYRPKLGSSAPDIEHVEVPLTIEHCHALGVRGQEDSGRRRTFNNAGARVCEADASFIAFEAHGGRGQQSFLRVVRHRPQEAVLAKPYDGPGQLSLDSV